MIELYAFSDDQTATATMEKADDIDTLLVLIVLVTFGTLSFVMVLCAFWPKTRSQVPPKKQPSTKNPDRDSRFALISRDDEVAESLEKPPTLSYCDQPSRSGVVELQLLPRIPEATPKSPHHHEILPVSRTGGHEPGSSRLMPSPLVLQRMCRAQALSEKRDSDQSPRSSSHLSSRPEPGDVDFEYDDFLPHEMKDEDSELWPPQKLDIKVFATAYEDILKELNDSCGVSERLLFDSQ